MNGQYIYKDITRFSENVRAGGAAGQGNLSCFLLGEQIVQLIEFPLEGDAWYSGSTGMQDEAIKVTQAWDFPGGPVVHLPVQGKWDLFL